MPERTRLVARLGGTLAVLLLAPLLTACGGGGTGDKGYVDGAGVVTEVAEADRKPVGEISGTDLQGKAVSVKTIGAGKPVVVNVWASWCAPCRAEAKDLREAAKQLDGRAAFLGINIRETSKANALAFERTYGVSYPSLYDPDGQSLLEFPGGISPYAVPSTVVIDAKGRVAASIVGQVPSVRTLVQLVEDAG